MEEIMPGIWHWTAFHEGFQMTIHSYYVASAAALIDPRAPAEGVEWFKEHPPERILLTNRHHFRDSQMFVDAYGCAVFCNKEGLHEFEGGPEVKGFSPGDTVAPGITVCEVGVICPDDSSLHIDVGDGALAFADGLGRHPTGELGFPPDVFLGDDPEAVKAGLRKSLQRLADSQVFDSLLFAHGEPIVGGGKAALRDFVA
jgi:hypothetical protein